MTAHYGDCRETMRRLIAEGVRVQTCVTSPPYWGLRDYGHPGQLGLERTPEEYVANLVEVFRLVRDLLADDGTLWLNLGDSYAGYWGDATAKRENRPSSADTNGWTNGFAMNSKPSFHEAFAISGIKPKDLVGIPWRVAFALQADGWYLRQDIIWAKPNPMPESVTDRCTKSHEYLFLLSKSARYYYDATAIAEEAIHAGRTVEYDGDEKNVVAARDPRMRTRIAKTVTVKPTRNKRSVWTIPTRPFKCAHFATFPPALVQPCILAGSRPGDTVLDPFLGSGTTGQVAQELGRRWIGCELNEAYKPLVDGRTERLGLELGGAA